jgi:acetylxylan esterase
LSRGRAPNAVLIFHAPQGGQIFDDAYCGGGDSPEGISNTATISAAALKKVA